LKLGQFLALRYDVLPPEIVAELNGLFENVQPMPFETARQLIERGRVEGVITPSSLLTNYARRETAPPD
jgi:predicted unusual protein kinase regulating ubiquinone biosynthesis (AarF/ABC1/UbiB family)